MLLQQVAAALTKLHCKGVVHQDLHSDNVLQALDGLQYKVSDLGNAAFHEIDGQPNELLDSQRVQHPFMHLISLAQVCKISSCLSLA